MMDKTGSSNLPRVHQKYSKLDAGSEKVESGLITTSKLEIKNTFDGPDPASIDIKGLLENRQCRSRRTGLFLVVEAKPVNANASTFKFWQSPVSIAANDEFALAA